MDKILDIIELIAYEKGLQVDVVQNIIKEEILKLAKNSIDSSRDYVVDIDKKEKTIKLFYKLKVVDNDHSIQDGDINRLIKLKDAEIMDGLPSVFVGDDMLLELNMDNLNLNRSSINILFKDLESSIERNIESQIFDNLKGSIDKIINGVVVSVDKKNEDTIIELDSIRARLARRNRIKGESFEVGQSVSCILKSLYMDKKYGIQVELSRTSPKFLEELLRLEVPEISDGEVSIVKCARLPGVRAKVAVKSNTSRVDAVGASVGIKGVRINEVSKKICGESIDVIEYSNVPEAFLSNALSPARINSVKIEDSRAVVLLYSDQKPKAIGRSGVNIRLASMLLGVDIDIVDVGENPSINAFNKVNEGNISIKENGKQLLESLFRS